MSFSLHNNFIDNVEFLSSSLGSLVKNLCENDFKHLSHEFDSEVDLVKQEGFYSYKYMSDFEKFKEKLPHKNQFHSLLNGTKVTDKEYQQILKV